MSEYFILLIFCLATGIQLFFWLFVFSRLVFHKTSSESEIPSAPPVSVIICARNEAANLRNHLHRFLNQNYRSYEVLVVNHNSCDETSNVLASLQSKHKHLRVIKCDDGQTGKKFALAKGIEQAKHQVLLMTDADCVPASADWVSQMAAGFDEQTSIVLGFSPYIGSPGPLNKFIRFEACYTAIQYLSFALCGWPYMGVGRNMAYRKALFDRKGGFRKHEHIASGDDDLFVNATAHKGNTGIRLNPASFTYSEAKKTWGAYFRQKRRHFSTGKLYKLHHKVFLTTLAVSHGLHYLGGLYIALNFSIIFALLGYAVRMCVVITIGSLILKRLRHSDLQPWLPALDLALVFFYFVFSPSILMNTNTQKWN